MPFALAAAPVESLHAPALYQPDPFSVKDSPSFARNSKSAIEVSCKHNQFRNEADDTPATS
jgi:hypothetical protein